ncbi:MAG: hypothetical protein K2K83_01320 [Rikenella sp.]|nr:hypothetical protein [Rikenella sp.]
MAAFLAGYDPAPGFRHPHHGALCYIGTGGFSWSSSFANTYTYRLNFHFGGVGTNHSYYRGYGLPLRCLQE